MNEITDAELLDLARQAQLMLSDAAETITQDPNRSQQDTLRLLLSAHRTAVSMTPEAVPTLLDTMLVMTALYAEDLITRDRPVTTQGEQWEEAIGLSHHALEETISAMTGTMEVYPEITLSELAGFEVDSQYDTAASVDGSNVIRQVAAINSLLAAVAAYRLAKLRMELPGLLEAYGALRAGASAAYTTGALEEYAMHGAKAEELRDEIMALVVLDHDHDHDHSPEA